MSIPRIEKDIPIVEPGKYRRLNKYPWKNMELNDSFLFPNNNKITVFCQGGAPGLAVDATLTAVQFDAIN